MTTTVDTTDTTYELTDVARTYGSGDGRVEALRGVDLRIGRGEMVAVAGPSGSGKTTLLQILGGLDRPTGGRALFEGRDMGGMREAEVTRLRLDAIGFVFQHFNLIPTLGAADNVELALAPRDLDGDARRAVVAEALADVGLGHRAGHLPGALSGGEQQRVAIARALAGRPRVLLADEPTGNLDSATGAEIVALLRRLCAERGLTVVLITHDEAVAAAADRTVRMRDGRLAGTGTGTGAAWAGSPAP
ncbi:ABC transporter ATP-binding protein [Miltoncostaea oceani]|uniref:ABC transporter ATP-binding protein n=1 Tax=Miltoncostaea oceani TaxID=2843216 RepID=UPI001C3DD392|nr:ABC transporter ATP-binding protein [Miltoncostaea oceani]